MTRYPCSNSSQEKPYGFVEWFRPGEYERTEELLPDLLASKASYLRTHLSWAEYHADGGQQWFDWLLPKLSRSFDVLPCIHYTPPSLSRNGKTSGAPRVLKDYADFIDHTLTRYGQHFRHVELWNEPNNLLDWDWRLDRGYELFCEMIGGAAYWIRKRGWKPVLGGPCPYDEHWLNLMAERGVLGQMSAVGIHGFPGTWDSESGSWRGWSHYIDDTREILARHGLDAEIWLTETGYSTWRNDEFEQTRYFLEALDTSADRMYWYSWRDVPKDVAVQEGLWFDPRHYHLGAVDHQNRPKLLARSLIDGGPARLRELREVAAPAPVGRSQPVVIAGGSGFIGCNLAASFLREGKEVLVLDNLSRPGVERNVEWLREEYGSTVHLAPADVRDYAVVEEHLSGASAVFHFAAQTAVTTSLENPSEDFEINARGTLNVLEAVRRAGSDAPVVFASTNKVYGDLHHLQMVHGRDGYFPADQVLAANGIAEGEKLAFCTPYGCSKGVADQYVLDYARQFGLRAAVLRMSCVYGPHQFGTEDQGWVAHFLLRALNDDPVTIYGNGDQVRDILHVDDAVGAYRAVLANIDSASGSPFNLGGGPRNAISIATALREIEQLTDRPLKISYQDWRKGDQHYFVADTRRLQALTGWKPQVVWREGMAHLAEWLAANRTVIPIKRSVYA